MIAKLRTTTSSTRLLLAALGLCGVLGSTRPAQADESAPAAPKPATQPRIFDGTAGVVRQVAYYVAALSALDGFIWAINANTSANQAAQLIAPLRGAHGLGACRKPLAVYEWECGYASALLADRDSYGNYAVGGFVLGGVAAAAATASIWLWRTPGESYWLPDLFRVTPTAGPKSCGVILQGAW